MCKALNDELHVSIITPWNIGDVPQHWIDVVLAARNLEANLAKAGRS
jgi:hypothetical protein